MPKLVLDIISIYMQQTTFSDAFFFIADKGLIFVQKEALKEGLTKKQCAQSTFSKLES